MHLLLSLSLSPSLSLTMSPSNFLSEGGFVPVHKGFFDDNPRPGLKALSVAVKNLDLDGLQGHKEWLVYILFSIYFLNFYFNLMFDGVLINLILSFTN